MVTCIASLVHFAYCFVLWVKFEKKMSKWMFYMINVESMAFDAEFFCVRLVFFTYEKKFVLLPGKLLHMGCVGSLETLNVTLIVYERETPNEVRSCPSYNVVKY